MSLREVQRLFGKNSDIVQEPLDEFRVMIWLAVAGATAVLEDRLGVHLDFNLVLFFHSLRVLEQCQ